MNVTRYLARKFDDAGADSFSSSVTRIAITSIAIGLAVMIVSFSILEGFRTQIEKKIFTFGAHLHISKYDTNNALEGTPIKSNLVVDDLRNSPQIEQFHAFARKTAIIKTRTDVLGVVVKGVAKDYVEAPMSRDIVAGQFIRFPDTTASDDVLISQKIADKLNLKVGDSTLFYFIQNPPRLRKFRIQGIYKTGLDEFDEIFVLADIRQIRVLNGWPNSLVGGYEVLLKDVSRLDPVADSLYKTLATDVTVDKITNQYSQLFDWLRLLHRNVIIFLILIIFVAAFNMVSTLLIMMLERTSMIGLLKALGATDGQISQVFFYKGIPLVFKGLLWGNVVGIGFCAIQYFTHILPLNPENYYMDTVPIYWDWTIILGLNLAILATAVVAVFLPTIFISRIRPVAAIRFD